MLDKSQDDGRWPKLKVLAQGTRKKNSSLFSQNIASWLDIRKEKTVQVRKTRGFPCYFHMWFIDRLFHILIFNLCEEALANH